MKLTDQKFKDKNWIYYRINNHSIIISNLTSIEKEFCKTVKIMFMYMNVHIYVFVFIKS